MKTIKEIRHENFLLLLEGQESIKDFAEILGKAPALISQLKSGSSIGDKLAREFEETLSLQVGWFDHLQNSTAKMSAAEALKLIANELEILNLTPDELELVSQYRKLNVLNKKNLVAFSKQMLESQT